MSHATEHQGILKQVVSWPAAERLALAQEIVATVQSSPARAEPPRRTMERALGLFRGPQTPPDDDDVRRILYEHRTEKYG